MLKNEFIAVLAKTFNLSKVETGKQVGVVFETLMNVLAQGDEIGWPGLGRFTVVHKVARVGRNPRTGKAIQIPARAVPMFKPAAQLKTLIQKKVKAKPPSAEESK